jgi:hypothetical protein
VKLDTEIMKQIDEVLGDNVKRGPALMVSPEQRP